MSATARFTSSAPFGVVDGWSLERLTQPSRLFGANGIRTGPDGRIYIAQVAGSTISALDLETGDVETVSAKGSDIVGPDDVAFAPNGDMYITEYCDGRVSVRTPDGRTRLVRDDLPGANGITVHQGRLFVNECRIGGRLMELTPDGGEPKVLLENLPMPNGMEVGPDGKLYYPLLGTNEIWRIDPEGGEPERVAADLGVPDAVKFDSEGFIVSTQVASGQVLRINPRNGEQTVLASLAPGLDNLTFAGERLFVSSFTGQITEILAGGETRTALADGLTWPLGLAVDGTGTLHIADGSFFHALHPGGDVQALGMMFSPGYPGYARGVTAIGNGEFLVSGNGAVSRYNPGMAEGEILAEGLDQAYGVAVSPAGNVAVADLGAGTVEWVHSGKTERLAGNLNRPIDVAFTANGTCLIAESGAGRIVAATGSGIDVVVDGLEEPHGIVVHDDILYIVDVGAKSVVAVDLETKARTIVALNVPVGAPEGVETKPLKGLPPLSGAQGPFAGIAVGPDGTIYISADAEGSVLALRKKG
ncbi:SMP-30/gluconolactonase/LRE family protein [Rhodococcus sp. B50]|uniref:SMP-30/gluconolactonase/LRE family protein n=1 Tax=Rhodococcus sp. B50 TaxID=2682847 RepID=UPI001FD4CF00|nr:SMP-30/gluconolactonase/LRE family protein [Rhodococcus sp. B50]MBS9376087.1 Gluconolactonase [Rhodococcus sp. B50]